MTSSAGERIIHFYLQWYVGGNDSQRCPSELWQVLTIYLRTNEYWKPTKYLRHSADKSLINQQRITSLQWETSSSKKASPVVTVLSQQVTRNNNFVTMGWFLKCFIIILGYFFGCFWNAVDLIYQKRTKKAFQYVCIGHFPSRSIKISLVVFFWLTHQHLCFTLPEVSVSPLVGSLDHCGPLAPCKYHRAEAFPAEPVG